MKGMIIVLLLAGALLFAGCIMPVSQPVVPEQEEQEEQMPEQVEEEQEMPEQEEEAEEEAPVEEEEEEQQVQEDGCTVEFQKDSSNTYYVMVKTESEKELTVTCPNEKPAEKRGELFFCTQLYIENPAIAYLDGVECDRAQFSDALQTQTEPTGQSCTVTLAPARITAGETSVVTVKAYIGDTTSEVSYLCGNEESTETGSGLLDTGKICQFDEPGTIEVYAKLDGEICATELLEVFAESKGCSVYGSESSEVSGKYTYTAIVAGRGYSGNDDLAYKCYDVPYAIKVRDIPNSTDFVTTIECSSRDGPMEENVDVTVGGDYCGQLKVQS